ncbi:MAG: DUF4405 domain-containing protein [Prolixibacteraceae bacterium]
MQNKFSWKSFVSFSLAWSFLIILISGIVLYIAPPGRVSNWTNWMLFGFTKAGWQAIHTIFSTTFVVLSIFHLFTFNWKVFWYYFTSKAAQGINKKKELIISAIMIAVVFSGTYFNVQPFKAIMDFGEYTTESWEIKEEQAPIPHAEVLTIRELSAKYIKMSPDSILLLIRQKGLKVDSVGQTILKISELNGVTPAQLYSMILSANHEGSIKTDRNPILQGLGRKTISEVAVELGKDASEIIKILKINGVSATPEDKIKSVSEITGKTPMEILEIIKK